MVKTPNLKKNRVNASVRSRAARRNLESPPPEIPTSKITTTYGKTPDILAAHISGGITKKKSRPKALSRKQKLRAEAGKQKGDNVRERTSVKILDSVGRSQRRNNRRKDWDDMNQTIQKELDTASTKIPGSKGRRDRGQAHQAETTAAPLGSNIDDHSTDGVEPALVKNTEELSLR